MTISFAGISADKVSSAPGLSSAGGGKYNMSPTTGNEVVIDVGTLPDGSKVSDKKHLE
jgi:hypothetical protein